MCITLKQIKIKIFDVHFLKSQTKRLLHVIIIVYYLLLGESIVTNRPKYHPDLYILGLLSIWSLYFGSN